MAFAGKPVETDPQLADTPAEATLLGLTARPLCGAPFTVTRPSPNVVHVELPPSLKGAEVAASLKKLQAEASPYRALLGPVNAVTATASGVDLKLGSAWPDLEAALCHPALALPGTGPFKLGNAPGHYAADTTWAGGRPYLDELLVTATDERGAERLFAQHKAQLALGLPPKEAGAAAMPFATGLLLSASLPPTFRAAFESSVDRADLVRFFVRGPAAPVLPAAAGVPKPPPLTPAREVTLLYDASLDDQRAVAARLQVRLNPLGYRLALKALPRRELRAHWASGDYQLMLYSVLLPPKAANALAVVLEVSRAPELAAKALPQLAAISDDAAREEKAKELLVTLAPQLNALPLYVQGLSLQAGPGVQNLKLDAWGLPRLDDAFVGGE